jgi:hypothetical protein
MSHNPMGLHGFTFLQKMVDSFYIGSILYQMRDYSVCVIPYRY